MGVAAKPVIKAAENGKQVAVVVPTTLLARQHTKTFTERFRGMHREGLERFRATGEGRAINRLLELSALHRDGHEFPVELAIWPITHDGATTFCAFIHDISERTRELESYLDRLTDDQLLDLRFCDLDLKIGQAVGARRRQKLRPRQQDDCRGRARCVVRRDGRRDLRAARPLGRRHLGAPWKRSASSSRCFPRSTLR